MGQPMLSVGSHKNADVLQENINELSIISERVVKDA